MRTSVRRLFLGMVPTLYVVTAATSSAAAAPAGEAIAGTPVEFVPVNEMVSRVTPAQLAARPFPDRLTDDPEMVAEAKKNAARALSPPAVEVAPPEPNATLLISAPGLAASDQTNPGTPPDTTGAIGPNHYVETINSIVGVYDRTLTLVAQISLINFFGFTSGSAFDPQINYDPVNQRWFYAGDIGQSILAVGWSKTADPSDLINGWCQFAASTGTNFHDYPKLGGNDTQIAIGTNVFLNAQSFTNASIWAIEKPPVGDISCTPPNAALFGSAASPLLNADGSRTFTPVPAQSAGPSGTVYIASAHRPSATPANQVTIFQLQPGPILTLAGGILVNPFSFAPDAPQPGTSFLIDTGDARLTQAVSITDPDSAAPGLWTQHTVGGGGGSAVRWYELLPATPTLKQQGDIAVPSDFVFNGAISPSINGNDAAAFYNRTNVTTTPSLAAQSRTSLTPLGMMDPGELLLGTSDDVQQDFSCNNPAGASCRWGDYTGATPDPNSLGTIWGTGELLAPRQPFRAAHWKTLNMAVTTP